MDIIIICFTVCGCVCVRVCVCVCALQEEAQAVVLLHLSDYCVEFATRNGNEMRKSNGTYSSPPTSAHHVLVVITLNYCKYVVSCLVYINIHVFQPFPWDMKLPLGTMQRVSHYIQRVSHYIHPRFTAISLK